LNGSPDQPDSKSLPDSGYGVFSPAIKVEPRPTSKRPLELETKPTMKPRVRGPKYIGPHISDSDETSDEEEDFEKFRMVTRITKIVEFHHAAALADIDLALSIYNGRKAKELGKVEEEVKFSQHERRMVELQAAKENERKAIVSAERKKRRAELRNRSILRDPIQTADSANYDALFDPSTFQVAVNMDGAFVLQRGNVPPKEIAIHVNSLSPESSRTPAPETPRARNQSVGRETPSIAPGGKQSAWKMKSAPSALSQVHAVYDDESSATPIPERMIDTPWSSTPVNPFAHSVPLENGNFRIPGGFPVESNAKGAPMASGWGKKPSPPSAFASGSASKLSAYVDDDEAKQAEADETPVIPPKVVSKTLPPVEHEQLASPMISSLTKKPNKKQRQANKKSGAVSSSPNKGEAEPPTPITAGSSKTPVTTQRMDTPQTSIDGSFTAEQGELSSTPRANIAHMMMKRQGLASSMAKSTPVARGEDPASTPRPSALRSLSTVRGLNESSAEEESPWERMMKKTRVPDPQVAESSKQETLWGRAMKQKPQVPGHRSADFSASSSSAEEEETPWNRMMGLKAHSQPPKGNLSNTAPRTSEGEEETPWQRAMRLKGQSQTPHGASALSPNVSEDETPWERTMRLKGQSQIPHGASVLSPNVSEDETPWQRTIRLKGQNQISWGASSSSTKSTAVEESDSHWEQMMRKASQSASEDLATISAKPRVGASSNLQPNQHLNNSTFPIPAADIPNSKLAGHAMRQAEFWHPGGVTPGATQHQMWNPSGRAQSSSRAAPNGPSQDIDRLRWMSDRPSASSGFADLPDISDHPEFVPASILKGAKSKKPSGKDKKVTIEEVPDEEDTGPDEKLPSNSRYVLDIVEPKPSVPSNMYMRFFDFEAEEDDTELSSLAPTPSTAPTSPPGEIPSLDDDELMAEIKKGEWENLLSGSSSKPIQNTKHARWTPGPLASESPSSQAFDTAKLLSALQSVNDGSSASEQSKPVPSARPAPETKDDKEKEPAVKPNKETKGKGKGKGGADKKGKSGGRR